MAELPAWATKKLGPLPVGGWVLLVGGGIGVVLYMRKKRAGESGDMPTEFQENEADFMYGVPIDSPEDTYAPWTPAPPVTGSPGTGGYPITPPVIVPEPGEDTTPEELPAAKTVCDKPTLPARFGRYGDAPNRYCPSGWHMANQGPCAGKCIPNVSATWGTGR